MSKSTKEIIIAIAALVALFYILRSPAVLRHLPGNFQKAVLLGKMDMPKIKDAAIPNVKAEPFPTTSDASVASTLIRGGIWEWSAQLGMLLGNGGKCTKVGSLMEKFGVNLCLERQDNTDKMQDGLVQCAKELKDGSKQCSSGYNFVVIMSGGVPQFVATTNKKMKAAGLGPEWYIKAIGGIGRSNGEDGCWTPASYKRNPKSIASTEMAATDGTVLPQHGLLVEAVVRDDDYNICVKHARDNGIAINPDEKTFDPDTINFLNSDDYIVAANDYVAGKCEDRQLVHGSQQTGQTVHVCVNGVATWTPGDVIAAKKRGGLVRVASSADYKMIATVVGQNKFFSDNHDEVVNFLLASWAGSDQIRAFPKDALPRACKISVDIYDDKADGDSNGSYWCKYFPGIQESDARGVIVPLGGSAVYGIDDNLNVFGISNGANDDFRSIYTQFAAIDNQLFPNIFKKTPIPAVSEVEQKTYINDAKDKLADTGATYAQAATVDYSQQSQGGVLGDANHHVEFATGSAQPLPEGIATLNELRDSLAVTRASIEIDGHTDNTGNAALNESLSRARAQAVADYLHRAAPNSFPMNRFRVEGYGSAKPVASNDTADGRAQNRRVEIVLRSN